MLSKKPRANASHVVLDGARYDFENWVRGCFANPLKEYVRTKDGGSWEPIPGLSADEIERRTKWNAAFRRVIWIKAVDDRERAAKEVLKYITKSADFCDLPECVEPFYDATKGARLVQTFGSWYGLDIHTVFDPKQMNDWAEMKCACGKPMERIGTFQRRDVQMGEEGRWYIKASLQRSCRGTHPRPTIRALDAREDEATQLWQPL